MTKLTSKIATALAILGLAGPALAATGSASTNASQPAPAQVQQPTKKHKKVAQTDEKKATSEKKATAKKAKKHKSHTSSTASSAKTNESAPAPAAPAPASK